MNSRIISLDLIRGIAILGILFLNIYSFTLPIQASLTPNWNFQANEVDRFIYCIEYVFMQSRFYTLLSILFGAGIVIFMESKDANTYDVNALMRRRLHWLLIIGLLHGLFIWHGDILFCYALVALFIYPLYKRSHQSLLKMGICLFLVGHLPLLCLWLAYPWMSDDFHIAMQTGHQLSNTATTLEITRWNQPYLLQVLNNAEVLLIMIAMGLVNYYWEVAGLMLIGMSLYKKGLFHTGFSSSQLLTFLFASLLISLPDLYIQSLLDFSNPQVEFSIFYTIAALPMALFYIGALIWLYHKGLQAQWLQKVGRMALSLYLLQSFVMVITFRWIWPELFSTFHRIECIIMALCFSIIQIIIAHYWLAIFKQGPAELLWRKFTYKKPYKHPTFP